MAEEYNFHIPEDVVNQSDTQFHEIGLFIDSLTDSPADDQKEEDSKQE